MYLTTVKLVLRNSFDLNYLRKMCGTWVLTAKGKGKWPKIGVPWNCNINVRLLYHPCSTSASPSKPEIPPAAASGGTAWRPGPISSASGWWRSATAASAPPGARRALSFGMKGSAAPGPKHPQASGHAPRRIGVAYRIRELIIGRATPAVAAQVQNFYESVAQIFERWVTRRASTHTQRAYRQDVW